MISLDDFVIKAEYSIESYYKLKIENLAFVK